MGDAPVAPSDRMTIEKTWLRARCRKQVGLASWNCKSSAVVAVAVLLGLAKSSYAITLAMDTASDLAYASNPLSAWQGTGSTADEKPPGTDDGGADYVLWRNTLGQAVATGSGANGNNSGMVDPSDFGIWRANFGNTSLTGGSEHAMIPEPSSLLMFSVSFGQFVLQSSSRRRHGALGY
jgi:hypothetical protein